MRGSPEASALYNKARDLIERAVLAAGEPLSSGVIAEMLDGALGVNDSNLWAGTGSLVAFLKCLGRGKFEYRPIWPGWFIIPGTETPLVPGGAPIHDALVARARAHIGEYVREAACPVTATAIGQALVRDLGLGPENDWAGSGTLKGFLKSLGQGEWSVSWEGPGWFSVPSVEPSATPPATPPPAPDREQARRAIDHAVHEADRPVASAAIAQILINLGIGPLNDWGGAGSFKAYIEGLGPGAYATRWSTGGWFLPARSDTREGLSPSPLAAAVQDRARDRAISSPRRDDIDARLQQAEAALVAGRGEEARDALKSMQGELAPIRRTERWAAVAGGHCLILLAEVAFVPAFDGADAWCHDLSARMQDLGLLAQAAFALRARAEVARNVARKPEDYAPAQEYLTRATELLWRANRPDAVASCQRSLGNVLRQQGYRRAAADSFRRAQAIYDELDMPIQAAAALRSCARVVGEAGRHHEAGELLRAAVSRLDSERARQADPDGSRRLAAEATFRLGLELRYAGGQRPASEAALLEASQRFEDIGDYGRSGRALLEVAASTPRAPRPRRAIALTWLAERRFRAAGDLTGAARCQAVRQERAWRHSTGPSMPSLDLHQVEARISDAWDQIVAGQSDLAAAQLPQIAVDIRHDAGSDQPTGTHADFYEGFSTSRKSSPIGSATLWPPQCRRGGSPRRATVRPGTSNCEIRQTPV